MKPQPPAHAAAAGSGGRTIDSYFRRPAVAGQEAGAAEVCLFCVFLESIDVVGHRLARRIALRTRAPRWHGPCPRTRQTARLPNPNHSHIHAYTHRRSPCPRPCQPSEAPGASLP
jgi:hypothetical protein